VAWHDGVGVLDVGLLDVSLRSDQMLSLKAYIIARENVFVVLEGSLDGRADLQAGDFFLAADVEFLHGAGDDVAEG
jgi:hypothetical protein